ncbi:hypothetical protein D3C78_1188590 [compost metagenome]
MLGNQRRLQRHFLAQCALVGAQAQLAADHAGRDQRRAAQRVELGGQAVGLGVGAGSAGDVAHPAQVARHQRGRRLGHDAHGNVHIVADQVVDPVLEQHIEHDARVQTLEVDQPVGHHQLAVAAGHAQAHTALQTLAQHGDGFARGQHFVLDGAAVGV